MSDQLTGFYWLLFATECAGALLLFVLVAGSAEPRAVAAAFLAGVLATLAHRYRQAIMEVQA